VSTRRQFRLPSTDEVALDRLGLRWETLSVANRQWVLIYGFAIPEGFVQKVADVAIEIPGGYPPGALDMAFFSPFLSMPSARVIAQTQHTEQIDGKTWQRWSRHRTAENSWRLGEDSLETHIDHVLAFLTAEIGRGR
jgi:hypothetical protein